MLSLRIGFVASALALTIGAEATAGTITVPSGGDLQSALDRAQPGDTILLQAGTTYVGNFTLGVKDGASYITIRSAILDARLPASGVRMTPTLGANLARLQSPNLDPAVKTAAGAHHWRLLALEVAAVADGVGDIIRLGDGSSEQRSLDVVAHDLVVDRCYVHGTPDGVQKRGIAINSASTSILNSWISNIKAVDQDSQAVAGWNGPGPFLVENNYLEAAGENFLLGGADPSISGLVPTGVTFRGNWVVKPTAWRGGRWQVKNLLELKNARGVVIEDNLFENNWQAAQSGYAILFTPRNQDGGSPWATVSDVTFRSNIVRHVAAAINILGHDSPNPSGPASGITIAGNLVYDVNPQTWGGDGTFLQIGDSPANVVVVHNTALQSGSIVTVYGGTASAPAQVVGFVFRSNLVLHNTYGIKGDSHAVGNSTISAYFPGADVSGNVIAGGQASLYPAGNMFPSVAQMYAQFVSPASNNYQLLSSSAYLSIATDGSVVGADAPSLRATVARVMDNGEAGRRPATGPVVGTAKPKIGG
jgi:hypothetical protein